MKTIYILCFFLLSKSKKIDIIRRSRHHKLLKDNRSNQLKALKNVPEYLVEYHQWHFESQQTLSSEVKQPGLKKVSGTPGLCLAFVPLYKMGFIYLLITFIADITIYFINILHRKCSSYLFLKISTSIYVLINYNKEEQKLLN